MSTPRNYPRSLFPEPSEVTVRERAPGDREGKWDILPARLKP